ncbi:hypothetical protein KFZ70_12305 [Tamlana fucoidanivorans]|uniref:Tetratricopeptide repeat protein n=1 Tax=Allotamlana fucoidanivorans TaxID=2583814 RepID=A0A5C4SML3_9FLAO|nr:hypothetical protein [Tamlana fucoidanivorans]TNJ44941.1 hypothetical protein FGF67_07215 [Tamlana fucoidanivorans]
MLKLRDKYNREFLFVLLWSCSLMVNSQIVEQTIFAKPDKEHPLMDLTKIIFSEEISLSFNISNIWVKASFSDIENEKKRDSTYLNRLLKKLENDSLNPAILVDIGTHYENIKHTKLARQYYIKAHHSLKQPLQKIRKKHHIDSARYFTLNGLVKTKLGHANAINDFKQAVAINPLDSIAIATYPVLLIEKGKTEEYDSYTLEVNKANTTCKTFPYFMLIMGEIVNKAPQIVKSTELDIESIDHISTNYDDILNFQNLNTYALKCKENQEIQNARLMSDILGLFVKIAMNNPTMNNEISNYKNHHINFIKNYNLKINSFNAYEINKIYEIIFSLKQLEKDKKLNEYAINHCLGMSYFFLQDLNTAEAYFKKAIAIFPNENLSKLFNFDDSYNALSSIYTLQSDTLNYRKVLKQHIDRTQNVRNTSDSHMKLAMNYFVNDDLDKAEASCKKVRVMNPNHFDASRLMAHLNFLKGKKLKTLFLLQSAGRQIKNDQDFYNLLMLSSIYQIYDGKNKIAYSNIEKAMKIKNNECALCDKLLQDYLTNEVKN